MTGAVERENVTLSLPKEVLKAARHRAVDRGVSLSRFLADVLEETVVRDRAYRVAMQRSLERIREGLGYKLPDKIPWTRDALHER